MYEENLITGFVLTPGGAVLAIEYSHTTGRPNVLFEYEANENCLKGNLYVCLNRQL
jgi:hypothetical protein